jgi:hypothetical protein
MVLRNLMKQAYEREKRGEPLVAPGKAPQQVATPSAKSQATAKAPAAAPAGAQKPPKRRAAEPEPTLPHPQLENLKTLRDQGILTEEQFQAARKRLLARSEI